MTYFGLTVLGICCSSEKLKGTKIWINEVASKIVVIA